MHSLIFLLRHGAIDTPLPRRFPGRNDPPLNDKGIRQALALQDQLRAIPFERVFSSPLQRAMQTATLVSGRPYDAIHGLDGLREISLGAWEGLTVQEVQTRFPGAYAQRGADLEHFRPDHGESFGDLANRCCATLQALPQAVSRPLLIVAHAGVNRVILSWLLHQPLQRLFEIPQDYCCLNILSRSPGQLRVEAINLPALPDSFVSSEPLSK